MEVKVFYNYGRLLTSLKIRDLDEVKAYVEKMKGQNDSLTFSFNGFPTIEMALQPYGRKKKGKKGASNLKKKIESLTIPPKKPGDVYSMPGWKRRGGI